MIAPVFSAFLGVFSFAILFHAPRRSYLACALCGAVAWASYLLAESLGLFLATTLAAIVLTLLSRMLSVAMKMPSTVFIVTGIFPLVPGAGIYHTMEYCIQGNTGAFITEGLHTLAMAGALAIGILVIDSTWRTRGCHRVRHSHRHGLPETARRAWRAGD